MKVIIVSGTPGSGKTKAAKELAKKYKAEYVDVNELIKKNNLHESYDKKRKSYVVDVKKLNKVLIKMIKDSKKSLVIDSHLSHYLPKEYVDICVITKCDIKVLKKRLEKRKYPAKKIRENLDAEIFDVCYAEALENGHKVKVIDTTNGLKKGLKSFKL